MTNSLETMKNWCPPEKYDWQENIKKLQTSPNYRKGHHLNSQWQSQITEKIGIATKIGIAKMLGLPEEQPEVSEIPNTQLELPKTQGETTKISSNNTGAEIWRLL